MAVMTWKYYLALALLVIAVLLFAVNTIYPATTGKKLAVGAVAVAMCLTSYALFIAEAVGH